MADQPGWILAVVAALEEYESNHGHPDDDWTCLAAALARVPQDVRTMAAGYATARRETVDG
jgi:hypothetical protein